ncbi:dihydroorotase [Algimonas ampicilliniresistens]|uniref:Dihydroorotase n=1 Tax=Algimonas ampicilliniresistens TaxID=1298735 RepID=A0ABQ5VEK1_9PROT|nr:dihydroorotase [Algimonas ampicilliniresistens]GLQ25094.1 dihydroorotase [Algimonas ampicilliniresistens]
MSALTLTDIRIMDPESGRDEVGHVLIEDGRIAALGDTPVRGEVIDGHRLTCAPGLIDARVKAGEPGQENRETLATAAKAALAGGVTQIVVQPQTEPIIDDLSLVDFILRKGEALDVDVHVAGALTKGLDGRTMTEIGLMTDAGAVFFASGPNPVEDAQIMRRLMAYSATFNALISNSPVTPALSNGTCAHESDVSARLGLPAAPAISERIMAERDMALAELTGGRLLLDLISSAETVDSVRRVKGRDIDVSASVSINHLALNELDIGDYRTFAKLDPPLREERDRQALLRGVEDGTIDIIVSDHDPQSAGRKRLPFAEAAPGAVGLELLLAVGLKLAAEEELDLMAFLRAVTINPADLLGLKGGRLSVGAPADLVIFSETDPWVLDSEALLSRSKNTPFDDRRMTGRVRHTIKAGRIVYSAT